ncbi:hypothetical protein E2542_SST25428 [Spatholobus suberectus]|nr:hypothetical protein E2542_SST25428 [Spatholobus suberectus]
MRLPPATAPVGHARAQQEIVSVSWFPEVSMLFLCILGDALGLPRGRQHRGRLPVPVLVLALSEPSSTRQHCEDAQGETVLKARHLHHRLGGSREGRDWFFLGVGAKVGMTSFDEGAWPG